MCVGSKDVPSYSWAMVRLKGYDTNKYAKPIQFIKLKKNAKISIQPKNATDFDTKYYYWVRWDCDAGCEKIHSKNSDGQHYTYYKARILLLGVTKEAVKYESSRARIRTKRKLELTSSSPATENSELDESTDAETFEPKRKKAESKRLLAKSRKSSTAKTLDQATKEYERAASPILDESLRFDSDYPHNADNQISLTKSIPQSHGSRVNSPSFQTQNYPYEPEIQIRENFEYTSDEEINNNNFPTTQSPQMLRSRSRSGSRQSQRSPASSISIPNTNDDSLDVEDIVARLPENLQPLVQSKFDELLNVIARLESDLSKYNVTKVKRHINTREKRVETEDSGDSDDYEEDERVVEDPEFQAELERLGKSAGDNQVYIGMGKYYNGVLWELDRNKGPQKLLRLLLKQYYSREGLRNKCIVQAQSTVIFDGEDRTEFTYRELKTIEVMLLNQCNEVDNTGKLAEAIKRKYIKFIGYAIQDARRKQKSKKKRRT